jgi:hypothetical protein
MANIMFVFLFREDKGLESFLPFEEHFLRGSITSVVKTWQEFSVLGAHITNHNNSFLGAGISFFKCPH